MENESSNSSSQPLIINDFQAFIPDEEHNI